MERVSRETGVPVVTHHLSETIPYALRNLKGMPIVVVDGKVYCHARVPRYEHLLGYIKARQAAAD